MGESLSPVFYGNPLGLGCKQIPLYLPDVRGELDPKGPRPVALAASPMETPAAARRVCVYARNPKDNKFDIFLIAPLI